VIKLLGDLITKIMSQEYISALAILLVSLLGIFKIQVGSDVLTAFITGALGLWVAIRRYSKGDITVGGVKK
jgi:hypothetical protein